MVFYTNFIESLKEISIKVKCLELTKPFYLFIDYKLN